MNLQTKHFPIVLFSLVVISSYISVSPILQGMLGNLLVVVSVCLFGLIACVRGSGRVDIDYKGLAALCTLFICLSFSTVYQYVTGEVGVISIAALGAYMILCPTLILLGTNLNIENALKVLTAVTFAPIFIGLLLHVVEVKSVLGVPVSVMMTGSEWILWGERVTRPVLVAFTVNPNIMAVIGVMSAISSLALSFGERGIEQKFWGGAFLILSLAVVMTESRGGIVSLLFGCVCFFTFQFKLTNLIKTATIVGFVIIPVLILTVVEILPDPLGFAGISPPRHLLWTGAVSAINHNPFGYGLQSSASAISEFVPKNWQGVQPHSSYLTLAVSGGILAVAAYGYLLFRSLWLADPREISTSSNAFPTIVSTAVFVQIFESFSILSLTPFAIFVCVSVGVCLRMGQDGNKERLTIDSVKYLGRNVEPDAQQDTKP